MPNPLSAVLSPPSAAAKSDANTKEQRAPNGAASFQTVMDQEADQQDEAPEIAVMQAQEPEAAPESEELSTETEPVEISSEAEAKPHSDMDEHPIGTRPDALAATRAEPPAKMPTAAMPKEATESVTVPDAKPTGLHTPSHRNDHQAIPRTVAPISQGSQPSGGATGAALTPKNTRSAIGEPRARNVTGNAASGEIARGEVPAPATPGPAPNRSALPDRAPSFVQMQLMASESNTADSKAMPDGDTEEAHAIKETSVFSATRDAGHAAQSVSASARAETARAVAGQMASVINARPQSGAVEIALNPEELGRVSIVLNGRDDGLHLTIAAERPETLDMMRRHLSVLEAEFRNLGLGDLSLDLGTPSDPGQDEPGPEGGDQVPPSHAEHIAEAGPAVPGMSPDGRIDIRI